jgi:hypothetical protein
MSILINTTYLNEIKSVLGYPVETGEFLLTDTQIKDLCIAPALRHYFAKFPKVVQSETQIAYSSELFIPFYDDDTYGLVDARITHQEYQDVSGGGFNSFLYLAAYNNQTYKKNFGVKGYNPNSLSQATLTSYQALKSRAVMERTIRIHVDLPNRQVIATSNRTGKLLITWAQSSNDFEDVKYNYIKDVIELSQGHMLKHAARTLGIFQNQNMPVNINFDFLNSEGDALLTKIQEKWDQIAGILLIKS